LDKKFVFLRGSGAQSKEVDKNEFSDKSWTKRGVNKLLKKLWDTGTADRRPGSGRPRSEKKIAMLSYA